MNQRVLENNIKKKIDSVHGDIILKTYDIKNNDDILKELNESMNDIVDHQIKLQEFQIDIENRLYELGDIQEKFKQKQLVLEKTFNIQITEMKELMSGISENIEIISEGTQEETSARDRLAEMYNGNPLSSIKQETKKDDNYTNIISDWGSKSNLDT